MRKSLEEILPLLNSSKPRERELGLRCIGKYRHHNGMDWCVRAIKDDNPDVRASAAWALDQLGDPMTLDILVHALYDTDFSVRSNAGWALVHLARRTITQMVLPDMVEILQQREYPEARHMAYLVLFHIGDTTAQEAIETYWD